MRRRARTDANQSEIVRALRTVGATVKILSSLGEGCPDLLVGKNGVNWLMEVKDWRQVASQRRLTEDEKLFHDSWRGQVCVVETAAEALKLVL